MTTLAARLAQLSQLAGSHTMAEHLRAIVGRFSLPLVAPYTFAAVLVAYSGLPAGMHTVAEHLAVERAVAAAGGYDYGRTSVRKKVTVRRDETEERRAEFEQLLARVKGQAVDKAQTAAKQAPAAVHIPQPQDIKPPRMPEIRGVESKMLRLWMPDLLAAFRDTYRINYVDQLRAQLEAAARARHLALIDDDDVAILAMML